MTGCGPARSRKRSGHMHTGLGAALLMVSLMPVWAAAQTPPSMPAEQPGAANPPNGADRREALRQRRAGKGNLLGHGGPIKAIAFDAASQRILTGSFDYSLMLWDVSADEPRRLARFEDHDGAVNAVAFLPGARQALAAGDDGKVALWDLDAAKLLHRFVGHEAKIMSLEVSPDGRWALSASWDRTARLWDLQERKAGPVLSGHQGPVNAAVFSADGASIFTASGDGTVGLWSRADGTFVRPLYQHGWGINVLLRLPDGNLAFGALNGAAGILDADSGAVLKDLGSSERPVLALAAAEKPGLLATGGGDGRIRVFRLPDGAEIEEHRNLFGPVWALAFAGGGTAAYYGGLDDFVTLWRVSPREPFEAPASLAPRRFQVRPEASDVIGAGELQFARKCSICHTLVKDGANRAGPTLFAIFGRRIGTLPGYPFSDALRKLDIVWNEDSIDKLFALGPDEFTPGSKMPLQRMTDAGQRAALIAYLKAATDPTSKQPPIDENGPSAPDSSTKPEHKP